MFLLRNFIWYSRYSSSQRNCAPPQLSVVWIIFCEVFADHAFPKDSFFSFCSRHGNPVSVLEFCHFLTPSIARAISIISILLLQQFWAGNSWFRKFFRSKFSRNFTCPVSIPLALLALRDFLFRMEDSPLAQPSNLKGHVIFLWIFFSSRYSF